MTANKEPMNSFQAMKAIMASRFVCDKILGDLTGEKATPVPVRAHTKGLVIAGFTRDKTVFRPGERRWVRVGEERNGLFIDRRRKGMSERWNN